MEKPKTSVTWERSNRRVKSSEIYDSCIIVQHTWGTFDPVAFKVILGSFSALAIFPKIRFSKDYFLHKSQPKFIKLLLKYFLNIPHKTLGILKFGVPHFERIVFQKFQSHHCTAYGETQNFQKRVIIERNGVEFGTSGYHFSSAWLCQQSLWIPNLSVVCRPSSARRPSVRPCRIFRFR